MPGGMLLSALLHPPAWLDTKSVFVVLHTEMLSSGMFFGMTVDHEEQCILLLSSFICDGLKLPGFVFF